MGLWGPLLELEDDLRLMKAISTVGSGLEHKTGSELNVWISVIRDDLQFMFLFSFHLMVSEY